MCHLTMTHGQQVAWGRVTRLCRVGRGSLRSKRHCRAFTLVELLVVLVILGILGLAAAPRFFDNQVYDDRTFHENILAHLRYAQKEAVAHHRTVCVTFPSAQSLVLRVASNNGDWVCDTDLPGPDNVSPGSVHSTKSTLTALPDAISFDAKGRPNSGAVLQVTGYPSSIIVENETGYVHES